jgi:hypothetical protein
LADDIKNYRDPEWGYGVADLDRLEQALIAWQQDPDLTPALVALVIVLFEVMQKHDAYTPG